VARVTTFQQFWIPEKVFVNMLFLLLILFLLFHNALNDLHVLSMLFGSEVFML
jgi:hypothetical protein